MPGSDAGCSPQLLLRGCDPLESCGEPERSAPSSEAEDRRCCLALLCRLSASCQRFQLRPPGLPGPAGSLGSGRLPRGLHVRMHARLRCHAKVRHGD